MPTRILLAVVFVCDLLHFACTPVRSAVPDQSTRSTPVGGKSIDTFEISPPRRLSENRVEFINSLAKSGTPARLELLRQHLYDGDAAVREAALQALGTRQDIPSAIDRFLLQNPDASPDRVKSFLAGIETAASRKAAVSHALVRCRISNDIYKDLFDKEPDVEEFFAKTSFHGGGPFGIVLSDGVTFLDPGEEPPRRTGGAFDIYKAKDDVAGKPLYSDKPYPSAWARPVSRAASPPFAHDGKYFMGDGNGQVICGDTRSGEILWRASLPVPPFTDLSLDEGSLAVRFTCDLETRLCCRLDPDNGTLRGCSQEDRLKSDATEWQAGDRTISMERERGRACLVCKKGGQVIWRKPAECRLVNVTCVDGQLFILAECGYRCCAMARLDPETGDALWGQTLENTGDMLTIAAVDSDCLWLFDNNSRTTALDRRTGRTLLDLAFSDSRFYHELGRLSLDPKHDRLLVDGSFGMIYSLPRKPFFERYALKTPRDNALSFDEAFGSDVVVDRLDVNIMPAGSNEASELFYRFANRFAESKFSLSTDHWRETRTAYEKALVEKARSKGLDATSLEACMKDLPAPAGEKEVRAVVPVNAYLARYKGEEAWILVCKWEYEYENKSYGLGHVCIWAVSVKTHRVLEYQTCG
jgi:hypothetical protein